MENDFGVEAVRLFDWLICLMKRKGAVKLPFLNVVKYKLSETAKDWSEKEIEKTSEAIGYGAVKYADLKINRLTNYTFNFDQMLNDKGNTAVYLLYAHARICSIIRKSGKDTEEIKRNGIIILDHEDKRLLGLHLLQFPEVFEEACSNLSPNVLCEYLYNLAEIFTFYKKVLGLNIFFVPAK